MHETTLSRDLLRVALERAEKHLAGAHLKRFRHVVSEAERVDAARDALTGADLNRADLTGALVSDAQLAAARGTPRRDR